MWTAFDNGNTIGQAGSENGLILKDEEHELGARITLEKCKNPPFSITCGIYGTMVHTAFASTLAEAESMFETMKSRLNDLLHEQNESAFFQGIENFVNDF
jgi:hypothetical protein